MKNKISCSNYECIHHNPFHNRCYLKIVCIGKKGECISSSTEVSYNEQSDKDEVIEYLLDMLEEEHMGMRAVAIKEITDKFDIKQ